MKPYDSEKVKTAHRRISDGHLLVCMVDIFDNSTVVRLGSVKLGEHEANLFNIQCVSKTSPTFSTVSEKPNIRF